MNDTPDKLPRKWENFVASLLFLVLLLGGAAVRAYRLGEPPRDFWTIRQYYNALSARKLYFQDNSSVPQWRREVLAEHRVWLAEPPVLEWTVARLYRLIGGERFWVYRMFTSSAWILGGFFVWLTARRLLGEWPALTAVAYFLFLHYGVTASRSWQPDPLMVMGVCAVMFFVLRYFENPSPSRLVLTGSVAAVATLFKPGGSVLTLMGMFGLLSLHSVGFRRTLLSGSTWGFVAMMILPAAVVVGVATWKGWYEPGTHFLTYWAPHLLRTFFFWKGWVGILIKVLTLPGLMLAVLGGLVFMPAGRARALTLGYALGYVSFALVCTFTTPNHDYWHLQIVPLAALCIGAVSVPFWRALSKPPHHLRLSLVLSVGAIWCVLAIEQAPWVRDRGSSPAVYAEMAREIGEAVQHSPRVIILDYDFGTPLRYYAEIGGWTWPQTEAMLYDRKTRKDHGPDGTPRWNTLDISAAERFRLFYADKQPEYFVVCRLLQELDLQPGLREFLNQFPLIREGARYRVYDLRGSAIGQ